MKFEKKKKKIKYTLKFFYMTILNNRPIWTCQQFNMAERPRDYVVREHIPVPHDNLFQSILSFVPLFLDSSPWPRGWFDITFIWFSYVQHGPVFSTWTGTFPTLFKIKVFRFIDKLYVCYRRHFLKAEQQSGQLRHHVITTNQSGVFPKIATQSQN